MCRGGSRRRKRAAPHTCRPQRLAIRVRRDRRCRGCRAMAAVARRVQPSARPNHHRPLPAARARADASRAGWTRPGGAGLPAADPRRCVEERCRGHEPAGAPGPDCGGRRYGGPVRCLDVWQREREAADNCDGNGQPSNLSASGTRPCLTSARCHEGGGSSPKARRPHRSNLVSSLAQPAFVPPARGRAALLLTKGGGRSLGRRSARSTSGEARARCAARGAEVGIVHPGKIGRARLS